MNERKILWVSGLKGFCSITVVTLYFMACFFSEVMNAQTYVFSSNRYNVISLTPLNILFNGSFSVYIFWTLSAFLLTYGWNKNKNRTEMVRKNLNKYFRILFPVLLCSIIAFLLIKLNLYFHIEAGEMIENSFFTNERDYSNVTIRTLLSDILWRDFWTGTSQLIPPLWTMKIEMLGSIMTSVVLVIADDFKYRKYILLGLTFLFIGINPPYICFIAGIWMADYFSKERKRNTIRGILATTIGVGGHFRHQEYRNLEHTIGCMNG